MLVRHRVEFVLVGGVAANIHGYPLPTQDVDVTPATTTASYRRLAAALREMNVVTQPTGTAGFADLRRDAIDVELGPELTVAVASLPDIIRSKEAAGRAKDQAALPALRATLERLEGG